MLPSPCLKFTADSFSDTKKPNEIIQVFKVEWKSEEKGVSKINQNKNLWRDCLPVTTVLGSAFFPLFARFPEIDERKWLEEIPSLQTVCKITQAPPFITKRVFLSSVTQKQLFTAHVNICRKVLAISARFIADFLFVG